MTSHFDLNPSSPSHSTLSFWKNVSRTINDHSVNISEQHPGDITTSNLLSVTTGAGLGEEFVPRDNSWSLMSFQTSRTIIKVVQVWIFPCILLLGVPTNLLNCIVFYRQGLKDRMNLCLFWLATTDLCYLLCEAVGVSYSFVALFDPVYAEEYKARHLLYRNGINYGFMTTSSCISVVIAVERCVCVLLPLKAHTLLSTRTMAVLLFSITALLQLAFSVIYATRTYTRVYDAQTAQVRWLFVPRPGPHRDSLILLYSILVHYFLLFGLRVANIVVVIVCTIITVIRLQTALAWRLSSKISKPSDAQAQQASLTKMLVLISCLFIVCSTPGGVLALWRRVDPRFSAASVFSNSFHASHVISYKLFTSANSSLNFFVYYWRSTRFKQVLHGMLCGSRSGDRKPT